MYPSYLHERDLPSYNLLPSGLLAQSVEHQRSTVKGLNPTRAQQENFSKILKISIFYFLRLFQSFSKAHLCKLTLVDLFGFFS